MNRCLIIGGGAAGMIAAIAAAEQGCHVTILEKNEKLGKKLFITGKGRCNVTNDCDAATFFDSMISNPKFLYSAYYQFDNRRMMQLLQNNGCNLKIERGNRVFPASDHSSDIIRTLQELLKKKKVEVKLNTTVSGLMTDHNKITGVILKNGQKIEGEAVILACGGASYPLTGSTGDGYEMAKKLGHKIETVRPALIPFTIEEEWCKSLQGLSLKNVSICVKDGKKEIYSGFGEMLFTHFGVSGPLILSASSYYSRRCFGKKAELILDLKPALTEEQLDKRILRDFEECNNKQYKNSLHQLFPAKMVPVMIALSGILEDKVVNEITKEERKNLVRLIKHLSMTITGERELKEAIITQGGIHVKEVNPSTMESKLIENLFFAGEILDIDGVTGGFNLQAAWSTGYLAGSSAAERMSNI